MQILTIGDAGGWSRCLLDVARVPFFPALHHAGGETPAPGLVTAVVRDWLAREILLGHEWVSIPRSRVLQTPEVPGDLCSRGRSIPCPATNRRLPTGLARGVLCGRAAAWSSNHARRSFFLPSSRSPAGCPGPRSQGLLSSMFLRFVRDSIPVICFRSAANLGTAETRGGVILLRRRRTFSVGTPSTCCSIGVGVPPGKNRNETHDLEGEDLLAPPFHDSQTFSSLRSYVT